MKSVIAIMLLMFAMNVQAQSWASLAKEGNATYVGGYFAVVSYACLKTNYTNDSGVWASGKATIPYEKGCAQGIWDAMLNRVTPYNG